MTGCTGRKGGAEKVVVDILRDFGTLCQWQ
jgi:hypothetical protein